MKQIASILAIASIAAALTGCADTPKLKTDTAKSICRMTKPGAVVPQTNGDVVFTGELTCMHFSSPFSGLPVSGKVEVPGFGTITTDPDYTYENTICSMRGGEHASVCSRQHVAPAY